MQAYVKYERIFHRKSNTTAAAKERETTWEELLPESMRKFELFHQLKINCKNVAHWPSNECK